MNLNKIEKELEDFCERVSKTMNFYHSPQGMLANQKKLCVWIQGESVRLRAIEEEKAKKEVGVVAGIINKLFYKETLNNRDPLLTDLNLLSEHVKKGFIPQSFHFQSNQIPEQISSLVQSLKGKKWQKYYGYVRGPLMSDFFILKKQDFHSVVESVQLNQLKFLMIEQKVAHKYQRNLVQQIFGRIFRTKGSLSLVLKIQVNYDPLEPPYNLFCYVEDIKLQHQVDWRPLSVLERDFNRLLVKEKGKLIQVSETSMLQIFLSQILVLPLQTLVSDFIAQITPTEFSLQKYTKQSQSQIIKQKNLKDHPSLRNPLLYFSQYLHEHSIKISKVHQLTRNKQLFASFYKCLEIVIGLILTDFQVESEEIFVASSVGFTGEVFMALWVTFHKINLLEGWMREVIEPIKDSITISQIIAHFCPIFNQICVYQAESFEAYRDFFINVQMQSYLASIVTKTSLQKYKDMYVSVNETLPQSPLPTSPQIYTQIFQPILHDLNLLYTDPIQVSYIFNFCCKYYFNYQPDPTKIEQKWKNAVIWDKCVGVMRDVELDGVDIGFDFMGYACGVDCYAGDWRAWERVRWMGEGDVCLEGVVWFIHYLRKNYEKASSQILSSLLQKSFKHKKFKICQILLKNNVQIRNFKQILKTSQKQDPDTLSLQTKQQMLETIKLKSPQMHRLYKWQELMLVHLKDKKEEDSVEVWTLDFGRVYLPKWVIEGVQERNGDDGKGGKGNGGKNGRKGIGKGIRGNLSRKDCRFGGGRGLFKAEIGEGLSFYIGVQQYPLLAYFYKIFLSKLDAPQLTFNFTSFFHQNTLYHLSQSLPQGLTYSKGLSTYSQQQLSSMTDPKLLSQSIILSMILLPAQLKLEDVYICPFREDFGEIFVVDWRSFYQKEFMGRYGGKAVLNTRNSLFVMDVMDQEVHPAVIKKYADIDVMKTCESIFLQCKKFTQNLPNPSTSTSCPPPPCPQLLTQIFQPGFILNLTQRLFKIKRAFSNHKPSQNLSHYTLLQMLHSETCYYYQEVQGVSRMLRDREAVLGDQGWGRGTLGVGLREFFGSFWKMEDCQNLFPEHYYRFCFQGPSESLADLSINLKKFKAFSPQIPANLPNYSNQTFQYIIKHLDLNQSPAQTHNQLLQTIKNKSIQYLSPPSSSTTSTSSSTSPSNPNKSLPLSFIRIKSMQELKETQLSLFAFQRVCQVVLDGCCLGVGGVLGGVGRFGSVMYLHLRDIRGLRYIGENTIGGHPMEIKHLKTLSVINCQQLISIDLKSHILQCLQLRNNKCLQTLYIDSLNLKNIYIYNMPCLIFQNISIYILKGIHVLLCHSSCRTLSKLPTHYPSYLTQILKQLLISFFIKQHRYTILLTLVKMRQVSEYLFTRAGLSSFRSVSSLFGRFSLEVQDTLLSQIMRIYFGNLGLGEVTVGGIVGDIGGEGIGKGKGIGVQRIFRVICMGLGKIDHQKSFKALTIQNSSLIFQELDKARIKTFIDLIKTQKYFTLTLTNLNTNPNLNPNSHSHHQAQTQLIRYLSLQKDDIQKLTLHFSFSQISLQFLYEIFEGTLSLEQMKREEEEAVRKKLRSTLSISRLMSRRSINQEYPRHMKINRIFVEDCQIVEEAKEGNKGKENGNGNGNGKEKEKEGKQFINEGLEVIKEECEISGLVQIEQSNQLSKSLQFFQPQTSVSPQTIQNPPLSTHPKFNSIHQLQLTKSSLQTFTLLSSTPNLTTLTLTSCLLPKATKKTFLKLLPQKLPLLNTLTLQHFFTGDIESCNAFQYFCGILGEFGELRVLRLANSVVSFGGLGVFDVGIGGTGVEEVDLDGLVLVEKCLEHKVSYMDEKIQMMSELRQKKQQKNAIHLRNFLSTTKNLKQLTIHLSSPHYIQQFLHSLSQNTSILSLQLNTTYEIPSPILAPLNNNTTLNQISSNMQLPLWVFDHVGGNRQKRKDRDRLREREEKEDDSRGMTSDLNDDSMVKEFVEGRTGIGGNRGCFKMGLSLDGGGIRGMLLATQLEYLVKRVGYPLHKIFDCIGGTSIGGILALLSTGTLDGYNPVVPGDELTQLFTKYGQDIFKKSQFRQIKNLFQSKYSPQSYQQVLKNYFKDCRLSNCLEETSVIVTAINRMDNKDYVFRSMEALLNREKDFFMRDVARATSAAPTYFPSAEIKNVNASTKLSLIDGGLGMNNPSKLVIDQVRKISANTGSPQNYFLLSLGTGRLPSQNIPESAGLKDISPIIDTYAESSNYFLQRDLSINSKGHFFRVSPSIIVANKKDAQLDNTSEQIIQIYRNTGLEASKKYFNNTVIFGKYRNMNLVEWLRENTARKYQF